MGGIKIKNSIEMIINKELYEEGIISFEIFTKMQEEILKELKDNK